jgi:hypothetical protein
VSQALTACPLVPLHPPPALLYDDFWIGSLWQLLMRFQLKKNTIQETSHEIQRHKKRKIIISPESCPELSTHFCSISQL